MVRFFNTTRTLFATILAAAILLAGCGSKSSTGGNVVKIDPPALLAGIIADIPSVTPALSSWDWDSFLYTLNGFGSLLSQVRYTLDMQKVTYQSTGADGNVHAMTGLLILPRAILGGKPSVPILMYQHGTEVYRPFSPSRYLAHQDKPTDYPEVMVAAAIASTGYAVALVDYEGMGDNTDPQPHVVGAVLAQQVIDLLKASRDVISGTSSPCSWNNQLFLMGYSEGGYVTMEATRKLQDPVSGFTVTASAPLSGPHDLSGVMRGEILANSTFKAPYFVPMILTSYNYAYGGQTNLFSPGFAMLPPYDTTLPPLFNGNSQSITISEAMGMTFSPVNLIVPNIILTPQFISELSDNGSTVVALLQQNDSYRGWAPTVPVRMIHHPDDDLVPYGNSQVAFDTFKAANVNAPVELVAETATVNIDPTNPVKTVHFESAFPELIDGWKWINGFKK